MSDRRTPPTLGDIIRKQRELAELPGLIIRLESQQTALHAEMANPEFYKLAGDRIAAKRGELQTVADQLAAAYARWEQLEAASPAHLAGRRRRPPRASRTRTPPQ